MMLQRYGQTMDAEQQFVHFVDFLPKALEEELIRKDIKDFIPALEFVEATIARLNGDRLAAVDEARLKQTMGQNQRPIQPFVNHVAEGDLEDQVNAVGQRTTGRRPPSPQQLASFARWTDCACWDFGAEDNTFSDGPTISNLKAANGGRTPREHNTQFDLWRAAQRSEGRQPQKANHVSDAPQPATQADAAAAAAPAPTAPRSC